MLQAGQQKRKVLCSLPSGEGSLTPRGLGLSCSLHHPASTGSSKRSRQPGSCSVASRKALLQGGVPAGVGLGVSQVCAETGTLLVHWYRQGTWSACTSLGREEAGHSVRSARHQEGSLEAIQPTKPVLNTGFLLAGPTGAGTTRDTQKQSNTPSCQRLLKTAPALHRFCKRGDD